MTDDLVEGTLQLVTKQVSSFEFSLMNHRRKYDGVFTPNDRITVQMKRIKWLQVFTGYLNEVPYFSSYPRTINLTASCSLKRLLYRLWDPGLAESATLLNTAGGGEDGFRDTDGGIADKLKSLLVEVGEWPIERVHIGGLPPDWIRRIAGLEQAVNTKVQSDMQVLGSSATIAGSNPLFSGSTRTIGIGPGTGQLPATSGKASYFAGKGTTDATGKMALTGEPGTNPTDEWYCAMRWPYASPPAGGTVPGVDVGAAKAWWKGRRILVSNPKNQRAIVLRAADWGPHGDLNRVIDMSRHALIDVLGASTDTDVEIRFAPEGASLGPYSGQSNGGQSPVAVSDASFSGAITSAVSVAQTTPAFIQGADGLRFTAGENLKSNTFAARAFLKQSWPVRAIGDYANRTIAGTPTTSDHAKGLALDAMVAEPGTAAQGADLQLGNAIAMWFCAQPGIFATKYVIWNARINTGEGWRPYTHPGGGTSNTLLHRDHVHVSFEDTNQTAIGPSGTPWRGGTVADFEGGVGNIESPVATGNLLNNYDWYRKPDPVSAALTGHRALMNDEPLMDTILSLATAGMRHYMAAPNGDFIAWFPDFFGAYGMAGVMEIADIEIDAAGFTVGWSDKSLITHQFATGAATGYSTTAEAGGTVDQIQEYTTRGIVSIEFPEIIQALLNIDPSDRVASAWLDAEKVLRRFGARVDHQRLGTITGPAAEFWYAVNQFQEHWAAQFATQVGLTFMPEIWPGMLVQFPSLGLQLYVETVTHRFDFQSNSGFKTTLGTIAPSAIAGGGLYGLPKAGGPILPVEGGLAAPLPEYEPTYHVGPGVNVR